MEAFLAERGAQWEELDALLVQRQRSAGRVAVRHGRLHRQAIADLAAARRRFPGDPLAADLEDLVRRSADVLYADRRLSSAAVGRFVRRDLPSLLLPPGPSLLIALVLLVVPAVAVVLWAQHDPYGAAGVLPASFLRQPPTGAPLAVALPASAAASVGAIALRNLVVLALAAAGGLLAGVGSAAVLVAEGVVLGALVGLDVDGAFATRPGDAAVHGVLQLSLLLVVAAAGLRLGRTVATGDRPLAEAAGATASVFLVTLPWVALAVAAEANATGTIDPVTAAIVGVLLATTFWLPALVGRLVGHPQPADGEPSVETLGL